MKRSRIATGTLVGMIAALAPGVASAKIVELGATTTPLVAPTCPAGVKPQNCTIVLTRVTALETLRDGVTYPTTVTRAGEVVAFTLGISQLSSNRNTAKSDVTFLDSTYGGTAQAAITVLKPVGKKKLRRFAVVSESPFFHLIPYLGQVVQFPLVTPLQVVRGEVIALTVPFWAPVLSFNLPTKKFAYRQSRQANCNNPAGGSQAQTRSGQSARYLCNYRGTRVEYSATEITNPVPPKGHLAVDTIH